MDALADPTVLAVLAAGLAAGVGIGLALVRPGRRRGPDTADPGTSGAPDSAPASPPRPGVDYRPGVGDDAEEPRDTPVRRIDNLRIPDVIPDPAPAAPPSAPPVADGDPAVAPGPVAVQPERPTRGITRIGMLRTRLARSQSALGKRLLGLLSRERVDEQTWEEIEETLLGADLGTQTTLDLVERLRERHAGAGGGDVRQMLREELLAVLDPAADRDLRLDGADGGPGVVLVVGVNGAGKTTTVGKLARLLVAEDRSVLLGAADTFRAAAADQLQTWGERVGVQVVRGPEASDPAAVAHDAVEAGRRDGTDTVIVDTAGRLQNKRGLMDELGKVKRVVEKQAPVTETLLVLDATTGQNGLVQAKVFGEAVDVTGVVLTKLDGTAKGGIVVAVQRQLGVPVKLVGLGEGVDDLAPFDPETFVEGLLG